MAGLVETEAAGCYAGTLGLSCVGLGSACIWLLSHVI